MLAIDHIVIASKNPEQDAKDFEQKHGIQCIPGGKHTNWGTYNYLAYFDNNCYIEWLGIFDESLARKSDNPIVQQLMQLFDEGKSGAYTFALRTQNMNHNLEHFKSDSVPFKGPFPGTRKKVDGSSLSWRMLFPNQDKLPFLIEWGEQLNLPDDKSKINSHKITSVQIPHDQYLYMDTFGLMSDENRIQLENGELIFTKDFELNFTISE